MIGISTPLSEIGAIGKSVAPKLKQLGLMTIEDLLFYFPRKYIDFSVITPIAKLQPDMETTVAGRIEHISNRRSWHRRMIVTQAMISDDTGSVAAVWFGQYHVSKILTAGTMVMLSGKATLGEYGLQFVSPMFEKKNDDPAHTGRLIPLYASTSRLTQKQIRALVKFAVKFRNSVPDALPPEIRRVEQLLPLQQALLEIHFPTNQQSLAKAQHRLKFDELFFLQVINIRRKSEVLALPAPPVPFHETEIKNFVASLPFALTNAQRKAAWQIIKNMEKPSPMNRLLEGDVGSGKTIVAAMGLYSAALSDFQGALMAPTEILASQHYDTVLKLLKKTGVRTALLTHGFNKQDGRDVPRKTLISAIRNGDVHIVVGTHALIQDRVQFKRLALAVIDEQHRFGVKQRQKLKTKSGTGEVPHLLSMTATPIPRTLYLTMYGDLDLSVLDELPKGRQEIKTSIVAPHERPQTLSHIDQEIQNGRQVFVLCPLIDESDKLGAKAVRAEFEKLRTTTFAHRNIGLLHGRMSAKEKENVMKEFAERKIDILVSTPVIEVGVDIPNASVMMIENAERFGLSQIWQLRGRVGRGLHQSYCFLFPETDSTSTMERLRAVLVSKNGFELAEKDLELRGPGEVYGTLQSGFGNDLRIATLLDWQIIEKTKQSAETLFQHDPNLTKHPPLKEKVEQAEKRMHFE